MKNKLILILIIGIVLRRFVIKNIWVWSCGVNFGWCVIVLRKWLFKRLKLIVVFKVLKVIKIVDVIVIRFKVSFMIIF